MPFQSNENGSANSERAHATEAAHAQLLAAGAPLQDVHQAASQQPEAEDLSDPEISF